MRAGMPFSLFLFGASILHVKLDMMFGIHLLDTCFVVLAPCLLPPRRVALHWIRRWHGQVLEHFDGRGKSCSAHMHDLMRPAATLDPH